MRRRSPSSGAKRSATRSPRAAFPDPRPRGTRAAPPGGAALRVLFLINEADPLIKVGGLADVGGSLPAALRELRLDVRMALPLHPSMRSLVKGERPAGTVSIPSTARPLTADVYLHRLGRVPLWLIDGPPLRETEVIYHARPEEDAAKHIFTSIAALRYAMQCRWVPDVVHANDWHTAPALYWMRLAEAARDGLSRTAGVLTIHNLPYLGINAGAALRMFGLARPGEPDGPLTNGRTAHGQIPEWARDALLALGIASADRLVAVSPTYAREILTAEYGSGLDDLLRARRESLDGILNGIDTRAWDPARDMRLAARFDADRLARRAENSIQLRLGLSLAGDEERPIAGIVARLDRQKGLDYALPALEGWLAAGGQVAVLGSGDPELERAYTEFGERHPGQVGVRIGYDSGLAALIYGGAHLHLMPSRYEPCGISQLIAMRYGCLPLVRSTGGLKDTVRDSRLSGGTGFVFDEPTPEGLSSALERAMDMFAQAGRWRAMQQRGMREDFGWARSAREYVRAYGRAMRARAHAAKPRGEGR
jgi:starch synthase